MIGLNITCCCCCCLIVKSCTNLCNPKNCSTPGFSVHYYLLEFPQTYVQWVSDAIKSAHHLLSLSPHALSISQHQGLFQWVSSLHQVGKILELSFSTCLPINAQGWFSLGLTGFISLLPKGLSRVFSSTTVYRHQFFGFQTSLWSNSHIHTWYWKKIVLTVQTFVSKVMSLLLILCLGWS